MKFLALALAIHGLVRHGGAATVKWEESQSGDSSSYDFVSRSWTTLLISSF